MNTICETLSHNRTGITELIRNSKGEKLVRKTQLLYRYRKGEELVDSRLKQHPGIQKLHHVEFNGSFVKLFLVYVEGVDFFDYVESKQKLTEAEARFYFQQLVDIVSYAHENGIIHRDLKLDNMILNTQTNQITVIDWNFATEWQPNVYQNCFCGSPEYAAPEMFEGEPYIGPEVDIYAMGVILYSSVVGQMPTVVKKRRLRGYQIVNDKVWYPHEMNKELKQLLMGMLCRDPQKRWTMEQIRENRWCKTKHTS